MMHDAPQRTLLFGGSGQLGSALRALLGGRLVASPGSTEVDFRAPESAVRYLRQFAPDLVINAAAFTAVDAAEQQPELARAVNATTPGALAAAARTIGARFVHVSTDYVFDGTAPPYGPDATPHPLNVYGATKLAGERAVLGEHPDAVVVRTAWVHSSGHANFVRTAVRLLTSGQSMQVVDDQIGTPTRAAHAAVALLRVADRTDISGILHFTDAGVASWFDVANCVLETLRRLERCPADVSVVPVPSSAVPRPATRPAAAVLDKSASWARIDWHPTHWRTGVVATTTELLDA